MVTCSAVRKLLVFVALIGCAKPHPVEVARPSILLVTLDTTRADAMRTDTAPNFAAIANRGLRFAQAYTPVPQTLAAHCSMMTGLYPAGHGVHENGRYLSERVPLLAEQLKANSYRTAAFISAFALARRFGLGRGFDVYD
jgi:arylsulfatase A-like enzyme